ncbi:unnamed protein product, partial [Scytosiphon promiscuus]
MTDANEVSIGGLLSTIKSSLIKILAFSLLCAAATFFILSNMSPRYLSEARVLVAPTATYQNPAAGRNPEASLVDQATILSQIQVIQSRDIIGQVVDNFSLLKDEKFQEILRGRAGNSIGNILSHGWTTSYEDMSTETRRELAIDTIIDDIQVVPLSESRVIGIRYHNSDPIRAAGIANSLANAY